MALLGIISDTHGRLDPGVWNAFAQVDRIFHAGDIGDPFILDELAALAPVTACLGNNDYHLDYGPSVNPYATATVEGCRIFMAHTPRDAERGMREGEYQLVIHGHTHVPRNEVVGGVRIVNPGSVSRPRGGSKKCVMLLEVAGGVPGQAMVVELG